MWSPLAKATLRIDGGLAWDGLKVDGFSGERHQRSNDHAGPTDGSIGTSSNPEAASPYTRHSTPECSS
jgi:hypothetical protein